jgi:hypothetical protein
MGNMPKGLGFLGFLRVYSFLGLEFIRCKNEFAEPLK